MLRGNSFLRQGLGCFWAYWTFRLPFILKFPAMCTGVLTDRAAGREWLYENRQSFHALGRSCRPSLLRFGGRHRFSAESSGRGGVAFALAAATDTAGDHCARGFAVFGALADRQNSPQARSSGAQRRDDVVGERDESFSRS